MQGVHPTKAALAVAMGIELGRWEPLKDLEYVNGRTQLKASAVCIKNSCKNTKAILGQQDHTVDANKFNTNTYTSDLYQSIYRQEQLIREFTEQKKPLPPAHKLKLVGGPVNLGTASCGPHYIFQVDKLDGTPLSTTEAGYMSRALCYYGQDIPNVRGCGSNPFIGFTMTQLHCPAGRVCVAIDPTDGDNSSTTTTTAGSAPTYTLNRVYDPANTLLNSSCTTTSGLYGTMQSKCSVKPTTCGYLYCTPA
jgi:hypothetical protein